MNWMLNWIPWTHRVHLVMSVPVPAHRVSIALATHLRIYQTLEHVQVNFIKLKFASKLIWVCMWTCVYVLGPYFQFWLFAFFIYILLCSRSCFALKYKKSKFFGRVFHEHIKGFGVQKLVFPNWSCKFIS